MTSLRLCSYNMLGYRQNEMCLKNNVGKFNFVLLLEPWLYPGSSNMLANIDNNYEFNAISFMSDSDIVSAGRSYGSLAAFWKNEYSSNIKYLGCSPNKRVMSFQLKCVDMNICKCNVYLPYFENTANYVDELLDCISYIEWIFNEQNAIYEKVELCVIGNFNVDCNKMMYEKNLCLLREFINDYNINIFTEHLDAGEYIYHYDNTQAYSMIDHCMATHVFEAKGFNVQIMDDVDDFSDHRPFNITLSCSILTTDVFAEFKCIYAKWNDDTKSMYYANTCKILYNINVPNCDVEGMCCSSDHYTVIDDYCNKIIIAFQSSTVWGYKDNGCHVQNNNVKWSLDLSKLKHEARQAHKIWSNNGRIKYGMLHKSMVECRKRYKSEIKQLKEKQRQRRSDYVESLLNNSDVNFWKQ